MEKSKINLWAINSTYYDKYNNNNNNNKQNIIVENVFKYFPQPYNEFSLNVNHVTSMLND